MKNVKFVAAVLALLLGVPVLNGHGDEPKKEPQDKLSELMQKKLKNSQLVLEGIALGDFEKIGKHADELIMVSKAAEWKVLKTPQYELYSNEFRRNGETLLKSAKDKNLDASALAYVELTLTCVRCHKHVREVRMARLD
jgi:hypothetical protein